jgi:LysR family cys regulon transcriptional activator
LTLQQLRYIVEVVTCDLNISRAAIMLGTSQPGISKQIRALEEELGVIIFERQGKHLARLTAAGVTIVQLAEELLREAANIRAIAEEHRDEGSGELLLGTTHTQARYVLPSTIATFRQRYPHVNVHLHQGTPSQVADWAARGQVDFAIATESMGLYENLLILPCYRWDHGVIVPRGHDLANHSALTLEAIASYPLITYVQGFTGRFHLDEAFARHGLHPRVVLSAVDADVIKTYVRLGLGVGIIAHMAYLAEEDTDLTYLRADHLFAENVTYIGFAARRLLRGFMYAFMELFAPHLQRAVVEQLQHAEHPQERAQLFHALAAHLVHHAQGTGTAAPAQGS